MPLFVLKQYEAFHSLTTVIQSIVSCVSMLKQLGRPSRRSAERWQSLLEKRFTPMSGGCHCSIPLVADSTTSLSRTTTLTSHISNSCVPRMKLSRPTRTLQPGCSHCMVQKSNTFTPTTEANTLVANLIAI